MLDYIVVGLGLAGSTFCETLRQNNKSFVVFNDQSQQASRVAGGLSNPVILKRFTLAWNANVLIPIANSFYQSLEKQLQLSCYRDLDVHRKFASVEEQNLWFQAADKPALQPYLSPSLVRNHNTAVTAAYDFGKVNDAKLLDTQKTLNAYEHFLETQGILHTEAFEHHEVHFTSHGVNYKNLKAKHLIFCEGYGVCKNPFFNYLPLKGSKGEYLIIKADTLKETAALKAALFVIPLGDNHYKVGANYDHDTSTADPTAATRTYLINKLRTIINCPYEIIDHIAGIRPTVKDRKPLVGQHPMHKPLFVLNGFGSHGIMIAPWAASQLYQRIENNVSLSQEINSDRYLDHYTS